MDYKQTVNQPTKTLSLQLQKYAKKIPASYGTQNSSAIISTELANQYMVQLISEKYSNTGEINYLTEDVSIFKENLKSSADSLVDTYISMTKGKGVYTVITATDGKFSHQNWLYYDTQDRLLIRFEPNGSDNDVHYPSLNIGSFVEMIKYGMKKKGIDITTKYAIDYSINNFHGCRATSTILATLYVMGVDMAFLKTIKDADPDTTRALSFILQKDAETCPNVFPSKRKTRGGPKKLNVISPV